MSTYTIGATPPIGAFRVRQPFDISLSTTYNLLDVSYDAVSSTGGLGALVFNGHFASTTGFLTTGNKGTLVVDARSSNVPVVTDVTSNLFFNTSIQAVVVDSSGTIFFADANNNLIYTTDVSGNYTIYAGTGAAGFADGNRLTATFTNPFGLAVDLSGSVYVSELYDIRKIDSNGIVTTLAGSGVSGYADGTGAAAQFRYPQSLTLDKDSNIYVSDAVSQTIRKITPAGVVTTFAGLDGAAGLVNGTTSAARFYNPRQLVFDASKSNLYFPEDNHVIRKIDMLTNTVSTYAGSGANGNADGTFTTGQFSFPHGITIDASEKMFVSQYLNDAIRLVTNNTISTYAGTPGVPGDTNGIAANATFNSPLKLAAYSSNIFVAEVLNKRLRRIAQPTPVARVATGLDIVASSNFPITAISRIDSNVPIAPGGVFQFYAYEPFSNYLWDVNSVSPDTLRFTNSSPELLSFLSSLVPSEVEFRSTTGFGRAYSGDLALVLEDLCGSTVMDSVSYIVRVGNGRFFPPGAGTANVFYKNETITPQPFVAPLAIQAPISVPTLPAGLGFVRTASNAFQLAGTPLVQLPASNYKIISRGTLEPSKVVTVDVNIRVNAERLLLDVCGSSFFFNLAPSVPITPSVVTAKLPVGSGLLRYAWSPALLDGLFFTDINGTPVTSPFTPLDASSTMILQGTPTETAARTTPVGPYTVGVTGTRLTPAPNITDSTSFTFSFGELVLFDTPVLQSNYYVGAAISSNSNYFFAQTKFGSGSSPIVDMTSPNLPSGFVLTFCNSEQRGYLSGIPDTVGSGTFDVTASNTNAAEGSITVPYSVANDQITFVSPTPLTDVCYNFILTRSLSNAKTGYYSSPIQFKASTLSGCNVTMSTGDLAGTGLSLSNVSNSTYQLVGIPTSTTPLDTLTVTADSGPTGITKDTSLAFAIVPDVFDFSGNVFGFIQNRQITPYQFSASTLSGRNILNYSSSNLPNALFLTPSGYLTGTMRDGSSGTFDVVATTGYTSDTSAYGYTVIPDSILLLTNPTIYNYTLGNAVSMRIQGLSFSGATVSNYSFSNFTPSYGLSIDATTGVIGGTLTGPLPASCNFFVTASVGTVQGQLGATLDSNGTFTFTTLPSGGPTFTSPSQTSLVLYQYMPITPIVFSATGTGTIYYYIQSADLPVGLTFDPTTETISGSPMRLGQDTITVYAQDDNGVTPLTLAITTLIPRIVKHQTSAGAYTSLIRQYTQVNAAQNARDNKVYPAEDRAAGEFQAPTAPDVVTQVNGCCE